MNYNENIIKEKEDVEVNFKNIFFLVIRKWRILLSVVIVCTILMATLRLVQGILVYTDKEEVNQKLTEYENLVEYNKRMKMDTRAKMATISELIGEQKDYIEDSIFMKINPYAVCKATAQYYVKTNYEIIPSMTFQNINYTDAIVNTYVLLLQNEEFLNGLATELGVELRYIQELVKIHNAGDGMLVISVMSDEEDSAEYILNYILQGVELNKAEIENTVDSFEIICMKKSTYIDYDISIRDEQLIQTDKLSELSLQYSDEQDKYHQLEEVIIEEPDVSIFSIMKGTIKYAIVGCIFGMFIVCCVYIFISITSDVLFSSSEFKQRYNLRILGDYFISTYSKIDLWIRKHEGINGSIETKHSYASAYIKKMMPNSRLVITGQADKNIISDITKELSNLVENVEFIDGANILSNHELLVELEQYDGVVLVEQCEVSTYTNINKEIEVITNLGKSIVGCYIIG